jgi:WhiB family redox-sensing transcriptional regulator
VHHDEVVALMRPGVDVVSAFEELVRRPEWHADAACAGLGVATFFPARGQSVTPARNVCDGCLVRQECLAFALEDDDALTNGVWGGTSAGERRRRRAAAA